VLHLHRAERADALLDALADLLSQPLGDPLAPEVVAVPTRGMERWLSQQLSGRLGTSPSGGDGICANVLFPAPRRLIADALAAASGVEPEDDPWLPERSVWQLLDTVEEHLSAPWLHPLALHLGAADDPPDPVRRARRLSVVRHLSALLDRYALHRPEMVRAWASGPGAEPASPEVAWQATLWRAMRARIGVPGPAERLDPACARLRQDRALVDLPPRLSAFGLTRLARSDLQVLRALSARRDVHLFLLHPSPALWDEVAAVTDGGPVSMRRRDDPTAELARHPLLASWGRDAREMQLVLGGGSGAHADHHHPPKPKPKPKPEPEPEPGPEGAPGPPDAAPEPETLLQRIQTGVRSDIAPPGEPAAGHPDLRAELRLDDATVQVQACHGRARQVEVLRDTILHLLAGDPTLEPRDVIVMCPDIETFAPLIEATFGAGSPSPPVQAPASAAAEARAPTPPETGEASPGPDLRVRLADRSLRQTNPVLATIAELLALVDGRLTASQVLDFADREPVRRRFHLDDDDLTRIRDWVSATGIRWGLDAAHRAPFKLDRLDAGTWRAGLDRLLLGVAMTEDGERLFADRLPLDDVETGAIDLAGRLAELLARLEETVRSLIRPQPLPSWAEALGEAADALTATAPAQSWQRDELQRLLDDLVTEAQVEHRDHADLALAEVRALLADRLAGRPTRASFRTGHLTVCTLYPMRSVPHRVVCLLGLDDGAFPRRAPRDGEDLLLADPHLGERDPRNEDRQLLLDALLAASERLVITYTAADERTNVRLPAAVPVGELLDTIEATVRRPEGRARDQVVTRHPLQPFDPRNFVRGTLVPGHAWSFDAVSLAGARALEGPRTEPGPFLPAPLPPLVEPVVRLEDLVRFVGHPVRAFLRQRLHLFPEQVAEETADNLPVELDPLAGWGVGQRLLEARLAGVDARAACLAEIARGTLPPGALGEPAVREMLPVVEAILANAGALLSGDAEARPLDIQLTLADGRRLSGTAGTVHGDVLLVRTFSRIRPRQRLSAWVRLLAATATEPERELSALTVGRGAGRTDVAIARIPPLAGDTGGRRQAALEHLTALVGLFDRGLQEPLPLYARSSSAYARAAAEGDDARGAARREWESGFNRPGEDAEPEHALVLGGRRPFAELLAQAPRAQEGEAGWDTFEHTRFGRLARRLWDGLLACEEGTFNR